MGVFQTGIFTTGAVVIKVDSGMSRNGCQPEDLPATVQVSYTSYTVFIFNVLVYVEFRFLSDATCFN